MILKKGSKVKVLVGKDRNKEGEIIEIDRPKFRAKVKGLNIIKKHVKTTKEKKGGIFEKENFINLSNLSILNETKNTKTKVKEKVKKWYQDWKNYTKKKYKMI